MHNYLNLSYLSNWLPDDAGFNDDIILWCNLTTHIFFKSVKTQLEASCARRQRQKLFKNLLLKEKNNDRSLKKPIQSEYQASWRLTCPLCNVNNLLHGIMFPLLYQETQENSEENRTNVTRGSKAQKLWTIWQYHMLHIDLLLSYHHETKEYVDEWYRSSNGHLLLSCSGTYLISLSLESVFVVILHGQGIKHSKIHQKTHRTSKSNENGWA